jgi:hypothetical protein
MIPSFLPTAEAQRSGAPENSFSDSTIWPRAQWWETNQFPIAPKGECRPAGALLRYTVLTQHLRAGLSHVAPPALFGQLLRANVLKLQDQEPQAWAPVPQTRKQISMRAQK